MSGGVSPKPKGLSKNKKKCIRTIQIRSFCATLELCISSPSSKKGHLTLLHPPYGVMDGTRGNLSVIYL